MGMPNIIKHVLMYISIALYFLTALILLSGIPSIINIFKNPDYSIISSSHSFTTYIPLILVLFLICIHIWIIWNIIKRNHISLILSPVFEFYFLANLYFFLKPFQGDKILVFDTVSYAQLLLFSAIGVIIISILRLLPIILYRKEFIN